MYMVGGSFCFALMGACIKFAAATESHMSVVFWRNFFGLCFFLPVLIKLNFSLKTRRVYMHFLRSVLGLSAMYCFFYGITQIPLAEAILLSYTTPIFIPLIALFWLKEKVSVKTISAIVVGFIGVALIMSPEMTVVNNAHWVALLAGLLAAFAMVTVRNLSSTESVWIIVFYYSVFCTLLSVIPLLNNFTIPPTESLFALVGAGLFAMLGQLGLTFAYSLTSAAAVGPWQYSTVVFASILGWLVWQEYWTWGSAIGALLIVISGTLLLRRKR